MRRIGLVSDPIFETHDTGDGHPERPARLERLRQVFEADGLFDKTVNVPVEPCTDEMLERLHDADYIRRVRAACEKGDRFIDSYDVAIGKSSDEIARLAAGSVTRLGIEIASGELDAGFAAVRPPGHHAERDLAMGFCLYGTVAVAARELQANHGVERVLICDWDVHHGNGTQHLLEDDPSIFYYSCHQSPLYPGTGFRHERGVGDGEGATLNTELAPGSGDDAFLRALREELVPAADTFEPDFVIISAGFDAHRSDPLAQLDVSTAAFGEATKILMDVADRHADGMLLSALEGGYDLDALAMSARLHVRTLLGI